MTPDLTSLIERVESGVGPDRELDGWVAQAVLGATHDDEPEPYRKWTLPRPDGSRSTGSDVVMIRHYTASLDAVLALIEAKLPGWDFAFRRQMSCMGAVWLHQKHEGYHASSPARALLAGTLRAIQESRND